MTVEQLIEALQKMPPNAVVLYEGDAGYALVGDWICRTMKTVSRTR